MPRSGRFGRAALLAGNRASNADVRQASDVVHDEVRPVVLDADVVNAHDTWLEIVVQVLHDAGVIHRDIKPSNLLLDAGRTPAAVLVAELGSAKQLADASGSTVTTGTPAYMAPERAFQTGGFDGRADVYALGVVAVTQRRTTPVPADIRPSLPLPATSPLVGGAIRQDRPRPDISRPHSRRRL
jgi:serine/threonine protein kinase